MNLHDVNRGINKFKRRRRIGRGPGSGHGKTAGRGHKGQKSRAGYSRHSTFQGGSMPMVRRIPKRGFNNRWAPMVAIVNIADLQVAFSSGDKVTPETARKKRLIGPNYDVFKVLGDGELKKKLVVSAHRFSKSAEEKIQKAGGTTTILPGKQPIIKNKMGSAKKPG
jgi:large subunit ribosomal protein L15